MSTKKKISYKTVCDFFKGKNDIADQFKNLSDDNPAFEIFIEIKKLSTDLPLLKDTPILTFSAAEKYLESYFCKNISILEAQQLKSVILNDENSFRVFLYKIEQHQISLDQQNSQFPEMKVKSDGELFKIIKGQELNPQKFEKRDSLLFFNKSRITVTAILSAAATFLILFLLPLQKKTDLQDIYNFDNQVPLSYSKSTLRGSGESDTAQDPELNNFINTFKQGMADYLANDYLMAIQKWQVLEHQIPLLQKKKNYYTNEINNFMLYYALCYLSVATSHKEQTLPLPKQEYLQKSIKLLEKNEINSDTKKYYYALSLVLAGQKEKAKQILSTIQADSDYAEQSDILLEQIKL